MATAIAKVDRKETECTICHEDFTDPKILPCTHLLCRDCLVTWLKCDEENQCPLCRSTIVDPGELGSKSCEDIADAFPTDVAMLALVESVHILNKDHVCAVCEFMMATNLCIHCGDMLCQSCTNVHSRLSGTRHHTVESLTSLTPERLSASRPTSCSVHSDSPSELFCSTHGFSVCLLCAMSDHQSCQKERLETKVKEACAVLDQLLATLTEGEKGLERAISQLDQHLADIEKNTQAAMADIDAAYDCMETSLQAWRRRLKELIKGANSEAKAAVHGGRAVLLERRGKLTSHRRLTERAKKTTPPSSMDEMSSKLKTRVAGLDYSTTLPEDVKRVKVKKLTLDPQALTRIEMELGSLGQLTPVTLVTPAAPGTSVASARLVTPVTSAAPGTPVTSVTPGTPVTPVQTKTQPPEFFFHARHGMNIVLSDNRQTAERTKGHKHGIVLSSDPMVANALYEVSLLPQTDQRYVGSVFLSGVTNRDPAFLAIPSDALAWDNAVVIQDGYIRSYGCEVRTYIDFKLKELPPGSRVGVLVDCAGGLHLYLNGQDQGAVATNIAHPVYAFFDLFGQYKKVKALPVTFVN